MNVLAIDTATPACTVALSVAGRVFQQHQILPRQQSNAVLGFVDALLTEAGCSLAEIDLIACGVGPGSFMGVRLAVSVVQGLAFARAIPVVVLSTLQIIAQSTYLAHSFTEVAVLWDARMNEVYHGVYSCQTGVMLPSQPDVLLKPAELSKAPSSVVVGNGLEAYREQFLPSFHQSVVSEQLCYPEASAMISLAQHVADHQGAVAARDLQPTYLRRPV